MTPPYEFSLRALFLILGSSTGFREQILNETMPWAVVCPFTKYGVTIQDRASFGVRDLHGRSWRVSFFESIILTYRYVRIGGAFCPIPSPASNNNAPAF